MSAPAKESPKSSPPPPADAPAAPVASSGAAPAATSLLKPSQPFTCLVLGASGATGRVLVAKLANNPRVERINAIVRRELPADYWGIQLPANADKIHQTVVDFDQLDKSADAFKGWNTAFSCLGSTRSKAGSKAEFKRQDFDTNAAAAALCKAGGTFHYNLMSTTGADHTNSLFHYLRTKGELEQHLINEVKFPSLAIFRPGVLLTERPGESRWGEWFAQKILPVFHAILPEKNCAVHTLTVAEAMMQHTEFVLASHEQENGGVEGAEQLAASVGSTKFRIFENDEIRAMRMAKL